MMNNLIKFFQGLLVCSVLYSCSDEIVIPLPDSKPKLVVESWFKNDTSQKVVKLFKTTNFNEKGKNNKVETGAKVIVICSDGKTYNLLETKPGIYSISNDFLSIDLNKTYHLSIKTTDGKEYASRKQKATFTPKIDGYLFFSSKIVGLFPGGNSSDFGAYSVSITYKENIGKGDNYIFKLYINGRDVTVANDFILRNDEFLEDGEIIPYYVATFPTNVIIGDTVKVEQMSCNKDVYDFFTQLRNQVNGGTPFSTPPAPVEGNIYNVNDNKELVLGMFIVTNVETFTDVIKIDNVIEELTPELKELLKLK